MGLKVARRERRGRCLGKGKGILEIKRGGAWGADISFIRGIMVYVCMHLK